MLTPKQILDKGITGKKVGELISQSKNWTPEQIELFLLDGSKPEFSSVENIPETFWDWLVEIAQEPHLKR